VRQEPLIFPFWVNFIHVSWNLDEAASQDWCARSIARAVARTTLLGTVTSFDSNLAWNMEFGVFRTM